MKQLCLSARVSDSQDDKQVINVLTRTDVKNTKIIIADFIQDVAVSISIPSLAVRYISTITVHVERKGKGNDLFGDRSLSPDGQDN